MVTDVLAVYDGWCVAAHNAGRVLYPTGQSSRLATLCAARFWGVKNPGNFSVG